MKNIISIILFFIIFRKEIKEGALILTEKLQKYKPKIAVFNGKGLIGLIWLSPLIRVKLEN